VGQFDFNESSSGHKIKKPKPEPKRESLQVVSGYPLDEGGSLQEIKEK